MAFLTKSSWTRTRLNTCPFLFSENNGDCNSQSGCTLPNLELYYAIYYACYIMLWDKVLQKKCAKCFSILHSMPTHSNFTFNII